MNPSKPDRPPEEEMWAGPSGQKWLASSLRFEETLRPFGDALLDKAALAPGQKVLDVGCGAGSMSLDIAARVAPGGSVTALDISPDLIQEAARRAAAAQPKSPIQFVCADAARVPLPPQNADTLVSRFGSMFFTDPYAAFKHLHSLLKPAGTLALAVWAPMKQNPWMLEMRTILAAHFDLPTPPPRTPGPFAFDDPAYLADILAKAGFSRIETSPLELQMHVGGPNSAPASAADFLLNAMSIAQRATEAPEPTRSLVRQQLTDRLNAFLTPTGVRMAGCVFLTTAKA